MADFVLHLKHALHDYLDGVPEKYLPLNQTTHHSHFSQK